MDFIQNVPDEEKPVMSAPIQESAVDNELEELLNVQKAHIKVVGTGGAGNNTINRITEVGIVGVDTIAVNTDAQDLLYTSADKKILLGKDLTKSSRGLRGLSEGRVHIEHPPCQARAYLHPFVGSTIVSTSDSVPSLIGLISTQFMMVELQA